MAIGKLPDDDSGGDDGGEAIFAEINITPLTDVFLVMLIIFMVSALAVQVERNQEKKKAPVSRSRPRSRRSPASRSTCRRARRRRSIRRRPRSCS